MIMGACWRGAGENCALGTSALHSPTARTKNNRKTRFIKGLRLRTGIPTGELTIVQYVPVRLSPHVLQALSYRWRRVGTNSIFAGARLRRGDGAISGLQTAVARCSGRQNRPRAVASTSPVMAYERSR